MKNLNDAIKDMKITNSFEDLYFLMQISQSCGFGGLGKDQENLISHWKMEDQ